MPNLDPPSEASCKHCGAAAQARGHIWGRNLFGPSQELIPLLWIHCPNCGHVTQPVDAESLPAGT